MKFDISSMLGTPSIGGVQANTVTPISISSLIPYHNHKFKLYKGERLEDMVRSVKDKGILMPIIVRSTDDPNKFEILAGHNRCNATRIAGLAAVPCIIKSNISDDEAEMYVIETNLMQRGFNDLSTTEQAAVVALSHSKMFSAEKAAAISDELRNMEGGVQEDEENPETAVYVSGKGKSKLAAVGTEYGLSKNTIARLIRINTLTDDLKRSIDLSLMLVRAGVELSYISETAQRAIFEYFKETIVQNETEYQAVRINMKAAPALRELFESFDGDEKAAAIMLEGYYKGMSDKPKKLKQRKLSAEVFSKYFKEDETDENINSIIDEALQMYFDREINETE